MTTTYQQRTDGISGQLRRGRDEVERLRDEVREINEDLRVLAEKQAALAKTEVREQLSLSKSVMTLLLMLADRVRLQHLPAIADQYQRLEDDSSRDVALAIVDQCSAALAAIPKPVVEEKP